MTVTCETPVAKWLRRRTVERHEKKRGREETRASHERADAILDATQDKASPAAFRRTPSTQSRHQLPPRPPDHNGMIVSPIKMRQISSMQHAKSAALSADNTKRCIHAAVGEPGAIEEGQVIAVGAGHNVSDVIQIRFCVSGIASRHRTPAFLQ